MTVYILRGNDWEPSGIKRCGLLDWENTVNSEEEK